MCRGVHGLAAFCGALAWALAAAAEEPAQPRLTDEQRTRMREWLDTRREQRGGVERAEDVRRRLTDAELDRDARLIREWREERGPARRPAAPPTRPRRREDDVLDLLPPRPAQAVRPPDRPAAPDRAPAPPPAPVISDAHARRVVLQTVLDTLEQAWPGLVERFGGNGEDGLDEADAEALRQAIEAHLRAFAPPPG